MTDREKALRERRRRNQGVDAGPWWRARLEHAAFRTIRGAVSLLPYRSRIVFAGRVGRTFGPLIGVGSRADRQLQEIKPDLASEARRAVIRGASDGFSKLAAEYTDLPAFAAEAPRWRVEGGERLDAARAASGGKLVVVSAHIGNWEAIRTIAATRGDPLGIIYRAANNQRVDDDAYRMLTATGWPAFRKGVEGARALFSHVRNGGGALILVDQRLGGAPLIDFLGRPAETSLAAAQLALKLNAPLLPAVAFRDPEHEFRVVFEEPVAPSDPATMMRDVNALIGQWIDAAPDQWFWFHRRWKIRPRPMRKFSGAGAPEREAEQSLDPS